MMLYLHVPFCRRKCRYCAFYSVTDASFAAAYAEKAAREIRRFRETGVLQNADSIYIGGGTPGVLPFSAWHVLTRALDELPRSKDAEFTVETNPESTTAEFLDMLSAHGVNRLSVGVQSLDDRVLAAAGRLHTADEALRALRAAKRYGFEISADLIYGLPGQTADGFLSDVRELLGEGVTHLSCYNLQVEEGTPFYTDRPVLPDEEEQAGMYEALCGLLRARGWEHYEISNFALPGHRARHNSGYWERREYLGIGPAAHSFFDGVRRWQDTDLAAWLGAPDGGFAGEQRLTEEDVRVERIMLGLRTDGGAPTELLEENTVQKYVAAGWGSVKNGSFILNDRGMLLSNAVISDLI